MADLLKLDCLSPGDRFTCWKGHRYTYERANRVTGTHEAIRDDGEARCFSGYVMLRAGWDDDVVTLSP